MKYWEVIYETGAHSVVSVEDEADAKAGVAEHHRRAKSGELGGPAGHPGERVVHIFEYDDHPAPSDAVNPVLNTPAHESNYAADSEEVDLAFLDGDN